MRSFLAALPIVALGFVPAAAPAAADTGVVAGSVKSAAGHPLSSVAVTIAGPVTVTTITRTDGTFSATLPPGEFTLRLAKPAYTPVVVTDVAVFIAESAHIAVVMEPADLSSLQMIAAVSASPRLSVNMTPASIAYVAGQRFTDLANPQINDVLQTVPAAVIQKFGSRPDTTIALGGVAPYETQVLVDGHPLSMGRYGVWLSEYFPSFLVRGAETQTGPGNTTAFANTAVGGTVNILTPTFSSAPSYEATSGIDSYGSQYSDVLIGGGQAKTHYVFGAGYGGSNGPYFRGYHCVVYPQDPARDNTPASTGVIQFCGDSSGSLFTKGEVAKLRYDFSPSTSLDAGFVGAQGGYLPQGASYGTYIGVTKIQRCFSTPASWSPPSQICTNPADAALAGKSIDAYTWYPGSNVFSNQPIFTAQLRSTIASVTLLDRPYAGNIERIVDGSGQRFYPYFWGPPGSAFQNYCNNGTGGNGTTAGGIVSGGYAECVQTSFSVFERDKLYGNTLTASAPLGDSSLALTWDFHGDNTFAYYNSPTQIATPDTTERYNTISLTADVAAARNLRIDAGLYDTTWHLAGSQPQPNATPPAPLVSLERNVSTFDPHVGIVYQPRSGASYRVAWGTSETFPFAGQVSGEPLLTPSSATFPNGLVSEKNPFLAPESSTGWDAGMDLRFADGSVASIDVLRTEIYDVFETVTTPNAIPVRGQSIGYALVRPINAANLIAQGVNVRYTREPRVGLGYLVSFALQSSQVNGIPSTFYLGGASLPANGQQTCGLGAVPGAPVCVPYLKGYTRMTYAFADTTFVALGADLEGKNNAYFQPPFVQFDLSIRRPVTRRLDVQLAVQNLLNTNNFYNLPMPNAGVPPVAEDASGRLTQLPSSLIPAPPRTLRLALRWHSLPP